MGDSSYIQYGCGWCGPAPAGWRNFDASPTLRFERIPLLGRLYTKNETRFPPNVEYGDIVKGLPVEEGSSNGIYCSHVLEHLPLYDFRTALLNTHRILRPGGIFRFVLPDLEFFAKQYIENCSEDAAMIFMRETSLGYEKRPRDLIGALKAWLGNSEHMWMWDFKSIVPELAAAGFAGIRRAYFHDSLDARFREVELKNRWDNCLGVECNK